MSSFVFSNKTTVYFGKDKLCNLFRELHRCGENIMIVMGQGTIKRNGIYRDVLSRIDESKFNIVDFDGVEPNPKHDKINEGANIFRKKKIDAVVAIGGGSVIDSAKGIVATACSETDDVWDIVQHKRDVKRTVPIIAIPTTAATGSEMNAGAVISNSSTNEKMSLGAPGLQPLCAFYNPEYTFTLPPYQTACGCADIIAHIFDSAYFNKTGQMNMLENIQAQVIKTVIKYAPIALNQPNNLEARENLMWASAWALNGFMYENLKQDAACHAIEHPLSAEYNITHGHGLAIIMPQWLRYILSEKTAADIRRFGIQCFGIIPGEDALADAEKSIGEFENFLFSVLGLDSSLKSLNVEMTRVAQMANSICKGSHLISVKDLYPDDVQRILTMCF